MVRGIGPLWQDCLSVHLVQMHGWREVRGPHPKVPLPLWIANTPPAHTHYLVFGCLFLDDLSRQLEACGFLCAGTDCSKFATGERRGWELGVSQGHMAGGPVLIWIPCEMGMFTQPTMTPF